MAQNMKERDGKYLPAQKELMLFRNGRWGKEHKADEKFSVLLGALALFLALKTNSSGKMPVSWRERWVEHGLWEMCP